MNEEPTGRGAATEFGLVLLKILEERGVAGGFDELGKRLVDAGYPYGVAEVSEFVSGANKEIDKRFLDAVEDVLGITLGSPPSLRLTGAFYGGRRPMGEE
ncbi:MAG: hypothetical protein JOZ57_03755 [Abitibacteriaceae bacterium]|nr:hypothetical protein [Abditibacteriaceae bacterium]